MSIDLSLEDPCTGILYELRHLVTIAYAGMKFAGAAKPRKLRRSCRMGKPFQFIHTGKPAHAFRKGTEGGEHVRRELIGRGCREAYALMSVCGPCVDHGLAYGRVGVYEDAEVGPSIPDSGARCVIVCKATVKALVEFVQEGAVYRVGAVLGEVAHVGTHELAVSICQVVEETLKVG